ncbi:hypothetical protein BC940DRAFT_304114 [Gongronella butleri]|nr:hypothetical protein BC940DRAFT_304114 [Gongronella butleri]
MHHRHFNPLTQASTRDHPALFFVHIRAILLCFSSSFCSQLPFFSSFWFFSSSCTLFSTTMDSLQSFTQQTNLASLLGIHLGLSLFGALATNPTYNIPIFFFGIWAYNYHESNSPIKTFTYVLSLSVFLDVLWFILHSGHDESGFTFALVMNILSLVAKPITILTAITAIQNRGDSLNAVGGWSDAPGSFPGAYQTVRDGDNDFA